MELGEVAYLEMSEENQGYCSECDDITVMECVEPDAEGYFCPSCGNLTLMGADNALLGGYLEIIERGRHPLER